MSGGLNPLPFRPGGAANSPYEIILKSLLQGYGTGLSSSQDSYVYAEAMAEARTIAYLWELSERLGNQFDPERMTDFLDRWVKILRIPIRQTDTEGDKRRKVGIKWAMRGQRRTPRTSAASSATSSATSSSSCATTAPTRRMEPSRAGSRSQAARCSATVLLPPASATSPSRCSNPLA